MISWLIASIIFSYAGYSLYKFIVRSKQGKCAVCESKKGCDKVSSCSIIETEPTITKKN